MYKRQVVNYHQMYLWEKGVAQNYGKGSNIPMIKAKNKDETDIASVSYTHLDVYKRQLHYNSDHHGIV